MALLRVRAVLDPSPTEYHATVVTCLHLDHHVSVDVEASTETGTGVQQDLQLQSHAVGNLVPGSTPSGQTILVMLEQRLELTSNLNPPKPYLVIQTEPNYNSIIDHLWAQLQPKGWAGGYGTKNALRAGLLFFMEAIQSIPRPFLVVEFVSDYDRIVDHIWENMSPKGWAGGYGTKNQLRAGLLAFMQSLPGN